MEAHDLSRRLASTCLLTLPVLALLGPAACRPTSAANAVPIAEGAEPGHAAPPARSAAGGARIPVRADGQGFTPDRVEVPRGAPATLVFKRTTDDTCATAVVFPALGLERALPLGQEVEVAVPTGEARTLVFQCGMGMYRSQLVIR